MKLNKFVLVILFFSTFCFLLLLTGFTKGTLSVLNPKKNTSQIQGAPQVPIQHLSSIRILAFGDSLTRGVGDEDGEGYVRRVQKDLKTNYKQASSITNLAVSGAKTSDLLQVLQKKSVQQDIQEANVIFLTIGGNDLFPGADNLNQQYLEKYRPDSKTFSANLNEIFKTIRLKNEEAPIYAFGYYNPFHNVEGLDASSSFVSNWNNILENAALQVNQAYVIPTFDIFYNEEQLYLNTDHFHPNKDGYIQMANRLSTKLGTQLELGGE